MASTSKNFHTSREVWNKYGTWKGAWTLVVPYLPYLPYLPRAHTYAHTRVRARAYTYILNSSMEGMEVWKCRMNKGSPTSTPVPYLH
ncbi:MAG: hypothetical protein K2Q13_03955 [Nitrosomonas sp.]|uniref:hypothetical protein n=1 Tax=Nitrosomonas sp. TaxID=42353 RepID=UPI0025CD6B21|nr:hypothetical protein [Nitrosomonas sp.]MBY0474201.1 hypothetical protein [Nitrosomonas sp.]